MLGCYLLSFELLYHYQIVTFRSLFFESFYQLLICIFAVPHHAEHSLYGNDRIPKGKILALL